MKIIGLCGYAQVGKDTAARHMPGWARFAFADSLKADLAALLSDIGCDLANPEHKFKARPFLVAWGATARAFVPDYWIERLLRAIGFHTANTGCRQIVVTDVRYSNEVQAILDLGGKVIRIHRNGYGPANAEEYFSFDQLESDHCLPEVMNSGTPEELGAAVLRQARSER